MPANFLGNYIRERRQDLGLTQEELAARMGGTASQAEISRLERGTIHFPRRSRLDALAVALEVSLGTLLMESGWMTSDEGITLDAAPTTQTRLDPPATEAMLADVVQLREVLLDVIDRLGRLEETIKGTSSSGRRPDVNPPAGLFDDWEPAAMVYL
jgi:transcriptional regulator with XRE-family HTH domain